MADLMTRADVITAAFDRAVEETKIGPQVIAGAQQRHILPILGEDFYNEVTDNPGDYSALVDLIKPVLAYYVKFYALPRIFIEVGSVGVAKIQGQNRQTVTQNDVEKLRGVAVEMAVMHGETLTKHLNDNEADYPLYFAGANPYNRVKTAGGIIFEKKGHDDFYDDCDDYTMHLKGY